MAPTPTTTTTTTPTTTTTTTTPTTSSTATTPPASTTTTAPATTSTSAPAPATTATVPTTAASAIPITPTASAVTLTANTGGIPGYTSSGNFGPGRTAAYIVAPFAIVAGTYFLSGRHQLEIHPNAGFFWAGTAGFARLRDEGIYGLKASAAINDNFSIEGNFGYINHFESRFTPTSLDQAFGIAPTTVHGLLYDVNGLVDFGRRPIFGSRFSPYVTAGVGGLSTLIEHGNASI